MGAKYGSYGVLKEVKVRDVVEEGSSRG